MGFKSLSFAFVPIFMLLVSYHCEIAKGAETEDIQLPSQIWVRLYKSSSADEGHQKLPLLVYYHGGGFIGGSVFDITYDNFVTSLVETSSNAIAISVNYRLAPIYPIPAAYDDSWSALQYIATHINGNGTNPTLNSLVDFDKVFLAGDSAGGNIAHNMAMRIASDKIKGLNIKGIALLCPYFWGNNQIGLEPVDFLSRYLEAHFWLTATFSLNLDDPRINPLVDPKLPTLGTGRVLVITGSLDPLVYRGLFYADALRNNGYRGTVEYVEYIGGHDSFLFPPLPESFYVVDHVSSFINQA